MLSVLLALTSAVAYGASDFVGGLASRYSRAMHVVLIAYPVSAVAIALVAPFVGQYPTGASLLWGAASGVVMALAMLWFYSALADGPMNIVSPLTAVIVSALPVAVGLLFGERPSFISLGGVLLAIVAVLFVSRELKTAEPSARPFTPRIAQLTVGAGTCFALSFVFTGQIEAGNGLWPLLAARVAATVCIAVAALGLRQAALPTRRALPLALVVGALDVVANVTMLYTFQTGLLSIGSALIALYPAVTIALAIVILRERTSQVQLVGLGLAAAAVMAISVSQ